MVQIINNIKKMIILFIRIKSLYVVIVLVYIVLETYADTLNETIYTFCSNEIVINLYSMVNSNRFQVKAKYIQHVVDKKSIWFKELEMFIFNKKDILIWTISCDQAQLINKKILDLYGCVYMNKIVNNKYQESVITKRVLMNLEDQSISSNDKTIIHGHCFYSISSQMHVNLTTHTIKFFGKIYTQYEIE